MENQIDIDKRHRSGATNIVIGAILVLLPIMLISSAPGLGLVLFAPFLMLAIIGGGLLIIRGLFLRFQSAEAKKVPNWIPILLVVILFGVIAYVFANDQGLMYNLRH